MRVSLSPSLIKDMSANLTNARKLTQTQDRL